MSCLVALLHNSRELDETFVTGHMRGCHAQSKFRLSVMMLSGSGGRGMLAEFAYNISVLNVVVELSAE